MNIRTITAALMVTTLMIGGISMANEHNAEDQKSQVVLQKAEWNAEKQRLEVKVETDKKTGYVKVNYGGQTYQMQTKEVGKYYLKEATICYDDSLALTTSLGTTLTTSVKVTDGSPEGHYCYTDNSAGDGSAGGASAGKRDLVVFASNDLGMHCACPGSEYFTILPPFNTLRAQVVERGEDPKTLSAQDGIIVKYRMLENSDASLKADPYYAAWLENMPKYGFGPSVRPDGKIQGVTGATLDGDMQSQAEGWWEVEGVPAFPDVSVSPVQDRVMTDPLGGPNRNPFVTAMIEVYDTASGDKLAETSTVVPVAFSGCCSCHLQVTKDRGLAPTEANSFVLMGQMHEDSSGINFSKMDPDGDGTPGPIRCSACHLDPAMGESVAPGYPGLPTSQYTLSNVIHRWHVENPTVLSYDPDLATDCYACHPGNGVGCFRGVHAEKGLWCTDCHGDLNQRVAEGQVDNPWSPETLPKCETCHQNTGEGGGWVNAFAGNYLNSRGHKDNKILCSSCHGSPHALYPSTLPKDNVQAMAIQGSESAIGKCSVCHTDGSDTWAVPVHGDAIPSLRDNTGAYGGSNPGGSNPGGTTTIDVAQTLLTTCTNCHSNKSSKVSCNNSKWMAHDGSRVSSEVFAAVSNSLTGGTCQASGGSTTTTPGGTTTTIDPAQELQTTCLNCHSSKSSKVSCNNSKWMAHDGSRVSSAVFAAVSNSLTGGTCQASGGSTTTTPGGTTTTIDPAQELQTTCLNCHHDKSDKVECGKDGWLEHQGKRVSDAVFQAVDRFLNGDCSSEHSDDD